MPPFRDDHILIISPGSTMTLAQLGLPESFTPAKVRIPSRMFPGIDAGTWVPNKIRELGEGEVMMMGDGELVKPRRKKGEESDKEKVANGSTNGTNGAQKDKTPGTPALKTETPSGTKPSTPAADKGASTPSAAKDDKTDTTMADAGDADGKVRGRNTSGGAQGHKEGDEEAVDEDIDTTLDANLNGEEADDKIYYEDEDDEEGAVWCMKEGRIVDWGCFFALLTHVYELINPTFHTPVLLLSQPCWTMTDKERICQFVFEKLKSPGFALMDSALATCWAHGTSTAAVVDVGYEKTDITPVVDFLIQELARTTIPAGGNDMNIQLQKLLPDFTEDMIEQLKHSPVCEILPPGVPLPGEEPDGDHSMDEPAAGTGADMSMRKTAQEEEDDQEGVVNVAQIVATGKTQEYLAKKEKEKLEKKAGQPPEKKQPNSKRERTTFNFLEKGPDDEDDILMDDDDEDEHNDDVMEVDGDTQKHSSAMEVEKSAESEPAPPAPAAAPETAQEPAPESVTQVPSAAPAPAPDSAAIEPTPAPANSASDEPPKEVSSEAPSNAMDTAKDSAPADPSTETKSDEPVSAPTPMQTDEAKPAEPPANGAATENGTAEKPVEVTGENVAPTAEGEGENGPEANTSFFPSVKEMEDEDARHAQKKQQKKEEKKRQRDGDIPPGMVRKEIEIGNERFKAAEGGVLHKIADAAYRAISKVDELGKRSECWDSLIIVGNGARLKGFKEALIATLSTKYIVAPSSSTIFTSELPSNISTPIGTGANTPAPQIGSTPSGHPPNPLLLAAATNNAALAAQRNEQQHAGQHHHSSHHSQTPTSIKTAKVPEYFPEWKDVGFEECSFLGAQVAAKVLFVVDQGANKGFLTRVEYNERGPQAIHSI